VRKIVLGLVIAVLATPAFAQLAGGAGPNLAGEGVSKLKTDREIKQEQDREAGYKSGLSKIPDAKPSKSDPWGGVRGATPAASGAKSSSK
jgi:hypothetical protein